jgi:putative ABC transport system permease protein
MFRATMKSLLSRKLRLTLSAFAVLLGVMFVSGALVMTNSLSASFDNLFAGINSNLDVEVTGKQVVGDPNSDAAGTPIPAATVDKVAAVDGVKNASGIVWAEGARVIGKNGKVAAGFGPPRFGIGWRDESSLTSMRTGRAPRAPNEVALDASLAKTVGYGIGDKVGVLTLLPKREFTVVGIFGYSGDRDSLGGSQAVAFTVPVAQQLMLGAPNVYSQIDVTANDGVSQNQLRDRIRSTLGSTVEVRTQKEVSDQQSSDIDQALSFFNYILLGFAGVALFVGIFLILNTFSMLVAQRTRELALLRAIGASRGQVIKSVLLEATVIGLIASTFGLAAGVGVGALLAWLFGNFGGGNLELALVVPASAVIAAFAVGLGVTLIAALMPALRASRIPPIAAMREAATPDKPLTRLTIGGGIITLIGAGLIGWGLSADVDGNADLWGLLVGLVLAFIGIALLTPLISRPVVGLLGRLFSWSVPGKLGRRNSSRNPRRTAVTAAALMVGIALVVGVSTILASVTKSIDQQISTELNAQLIVSGQQSSAIPPAFDESALVAMQKIPGVEAVAGAYFDAAKINGKDAFLVAVNDSKAANEITGIKPVSGTINLGPREFILDEKTAKDRGLKAGDSVPVQLTKGGPVNYTLIGTYKSDAFNGFIASKDAVAGFRTNQPSQAFIKVADGTSVTGVQKEVEKLLVDSPEVNVQNQSEYVDQISGQFDTVLVMIQILLAMAILIAVLGIINTLALSVIERTREIGLLRAIGLRRSQTMRMVTVESVVISVFGALLGIVVGLGLGAAVVQALKSQGITEFGLPYTQIVIYLVLSAVVGVVAAVLPAIRAARLNVLAAISYE